MTETLYEYTQATCRAMRWLMQRHIAGLGRGTSLYAFSRSGELLQWSAP